ncbi:MAG TPA: alpha/beta hydrolase [Verrucomicrobiae bacterium]|nr:alpha/beta hydrolase [Verrucomicrobiae bacterium]
MRKIYTVLAWIILGFAFNICTAQEQKIQPDSIVQITAEAEGLSRVDPATLPLLAPCWWTVFPDSGPLPMPCPPFDLSVPVYELADGSYLVDETGGTNGTIAMIERQGNAIADQIEQVDQTQFEHSMAMAFDMDLPTPGDGGDDGGRTNLFSTSFTPIDYGTNLWIAQACITNGMLTGIGTNTITDIQYEIQSRTNLVQTDWQSEGFVYGSEEANWTPLSVAQSGRTNLFIRLRSWADDGSGLPIWWQLQYFGTNGVDPYGDPAGDGWNNYQKFQNGWDPNQFYTPPAPYGLSVALNSGTGGAILSWLPSMGAVTNYLVTKTDNQTGLTDNFNMPPNAGNFLDDLSGDEPFDLADWGPQLSVNYSVTAQYARGNSSPGTVTLGLQAPPSVVALRGALGNLYLIVSALPPNVTAIKVYRSPNSNYYLGQEIYGAKSRYLQPYEQIPDELDGGYFEISSSGITNGIYPIPTNQASPFGSYHFWVQGELANGTNTEWSGGAIYDWTVCNGPFIDARQQIKDNLRFLLRAAATNNPFMFLAYDPPSYSFSAWPTNYVYSGCFYQTAGFGGEFNTSFDPTQPIVVNYELRNFCYDPNYINPSTGAFTTGAYQGDIYLDAYDSDTMFITSNPAILFDVGTLLGSYTPVVPASVLNPAQSQWIYPSELPKNNPFSSGPSDGQNIYGLKYVSVREISVTNDTIYSTVHSSTWDWTTIYNMYFETEQPAFELDSYYFARAGADPMPEGNGFAMTNATPLFLQSVGSSQQFAGYAKLAVTNGYTGTYAYLGQYFDESYKIDTNGNITATKTGILSPYGEFFATEPGRVALVTMPDIDTGERGTNIVHCVSLQVDKNHDGVMDSSFNGPDTTSLASPMVCWVNNGYTVAGTGGDLDKDLPVPADHPEYKNYLAGKVTCPRDLENFFRMWIRGVPQLPSTQGYAVTFSMIAMSGNPAINLYDSSDSAGGTGYLTDTNVAADQARTVFSSNLNPEYGNSLATISSTQSYTLPASYFDFNYPYHSRYLFEGAGIGLGQLTMTISQNGNVLCQSSVWLDLHDIKDLYEQAHAVNVPDGLPPSRSTSQFIIDRRTSTAADESPQIVVFVHGINNTEFDYYNSTEAIFKRLYWSGYHGKVAGFRWPCAYLPFDNTLNPFNYNLGEFYAWHSASALKDYLTYLNNRANMANYQINILAHSQGNIVASEAVRLGAPFDNYVLTQGAAPAHSYDAGAPSLSDVLAAEAITPTALFATNGGYQGYFSGVTGNLINFYNTNDFALESGTWHGLQANWVANQISQKPEDYGYRNGQTYSYNPDTFITSAGYSFSDYTVTNPYEIMSQVARSRSRAVGAQENVGGVINATLSVDLKTTFQFGNTRAEHSAEFLRPIQTVLGYYQTLLNRIQPAE